MSKKRSGDMQSWGKSTFQIKQGGRGTVPRKTENLADFLEAEQESQDEAKRDL